MIIKILKKIVFSIILLYSFNIIAVKFGIIVPINYVTVLLVTILDIPAITMLVFSLIMYFK